MITSMTGYGRASATVAGKDITVEIKAVNHRFFEFAARVPRAYNFLEERLKSLVQARCARGKVDVNVIILTLDDSGSDVQINQPLATAYLTALRDMGTKLGLEDDITITALSRFGDIFLVRKTPEGEDSVWAAVQQVATEALAGFVTMKQAEGDRLKTDFLQRLSTIEGYVEDVERQSPLTVESYRARLTQKMEETLANTSIDPARLLTEAAIFSEKIAVDEETVRLRSHMAQFKKFVNAPEAVGRKLDFLVQEFNREVNTIGSKAQDLEIAKIVVELKSEVEKIREQVQNVE